MPDEETLSRRLRAVERSLTDGDADVEPLRDAGALVERVESVESKLAAAEDRIADLEAQTQALRGYVGNVRSVNEDVERRADAALAATERLENRLDATDPPSSPSGRRPRDRPPRETGHRSGHRDDAEPVGETDVAARAYDHASGGLGSTETDGGNGDADDGDDGDGLVQRVRDVL